MMEWFVGYSTSVCLWMEWFIDHGMFDVIMKSLIDYVMVDGLREVLSIEMIG